MEQLTSDKIVSMVQDHIDTILYPLVGLLIMFGEKGICSSSLSESQILVIELLYRKGYINIEESIKDRQIYKLIDENLRSEDIYLYKDEFDEDFNDSINWSIYWS
jgi:hypothetical protein